MSSSPESSLAPTSKPARFRVYLWVALKNVLGWVLILLALTAGPLVPGPGGIPLFLIGFTLISFPGKRKISARVLRGRPLQLRSRTLQLVIVGLSVAVAAITLGLLEGPRELLPPAMREGRGLIISYVFLVVLNGLMLVGAVLVLNLLLRLMPAIRRRIRPWLRRHHVRLLPPRYRRRRAHEHGAGPIRLKGEIMTYIRKRHRPRSGAGF